MIQEEKKYQSIGCSYYDQLEAYATERTQCEIVYKDSTVEKNAHGVIVDLYAKDGAEYLKLNDGTVIRLDHLVSVNGKQLQYVC